MTSLQSINDILSAALIEVRNKHGLAAHTIRVEWLGTVDRPAIAIARIEVEGTTNAALAQGQGEPVAEEVTLFECVSCNHLYQDRVTRCDCMPEEQKFNRWLARPQPAEQQPEPCHECGGNGAGGEHEEDCSQQVAPDGAQLVEALERISKRASEAECRQVPCSPIQRLFVDIMQQADDALAAHRKQGGEK